METRVYRGPNIWSYDKAIHLVVDLGGARAVPDRQAARLHRPPARGAARPVATTPARAAARAASSSGCTRAPGSATSPSTPRSRCSRWSATTSGAARPAGSRASPGRYNVIYGYIDENVGLAAGRLAVRLVNHLVQADPEFDWEAELESFILRAERTAFGPSTQAILDEAVSRDIPWIRLNQYSLVQLGQGVHAKRIRATMTSRDQLDRRRHRLRQGPHHQAARRGRAAGARSRSRCAPPTRPSRPPAGSASPSSSSRSTATTAAASASTCRTTTTCARPSRSPRSSRGAGVCIVESFVTGKDYRCLIIDGRMAAIAERVPGVGHRRRRAPPSASWST